MKLSSLKVLRTLTKAVLKDLGKSQCKSEVFGCHMCDMTRTTERFLSMISGYYMSDEEIKKWEKRIIEVKKLKYKTSKKIKAV